MVNCTTRCHVCSDTKVGLKEVKRPMGPTLTKTWRLRDFIARNYA